MPHQDLWLRDSGPIFVARNDHLVLVDWEFNGWGGKYPADLDNQIPTHVARILDSGPPYQPGIVMEGGSLEVNGQGLAITTRQCLLTPTRNPTLSERDLELALGQYLGIHEVVWLDDGLEGDHTDGHIDTITRFVDEGTIVTSICIDRSDPNHATLSDNLERLQSLGAMRLPHRRTADPDRTGRIRRRASAADLRQLLHRQRRRASFPTYGRPRRSTRRSRFCGRSSRTARSWPMPARALITGGGAFHCVTQQQPVGRPWRAA